MDYSVIDDRQVGERRKIKKLRYSRLGEDWGADVSTEDEAGDHTTREEPKSTMVRDRSGEQYKWWGRT